MKQRWEQLADERKSGTVCSQGPLRIIGVSQAGTVQVQVQVQVQAWLLWAISPTI